MPIPQLVAKGKSLKSEGIGSNPNCTVTEYVQRFRSIAKVVTKCALLMDPDEL
jgi:hypothetical protein